MTPEEHVLLMFAMTLQKSDISQTVRTTVFDYLSKNENIDSLETIVGKVDQIQSNYVSTQRATSNIRRMKEENYLSSQGSQDRSRNQKGTVTYVMENIVTGRKSAATPVNNVA